MNARSRPRGRRRARGLLPVGLGLALAFAAARPVGAATSGEFSLEVVVPAGAWRGVRLRRIPENATLTASVDSDGEIALALLDAEQYAAFPASAKAVFRGRTDGKLSFTVRAPVRGDYYVIVDNRGGTETRTVQVTIRGEVAGAGRDPELRSGPGT